MPDLADNFDQNVLRVLLEKAEPLLRSRLDGLGVSGPDELDKATAAEVFGSVITQISVEHFPDSNIEAMTHMLQSIVHPKFWPSIQHVQQNTTQQTDAFGFAAGVEDAIALAGMGLPVAPFDRKSPRILASVSRSIDVVQASFQSFRSAYVGYSPCEVPFYVLLTDSIRSLKRYLSRGDQALEDVNSLLHRHDLEITVPDSHPFRHGMFLFPREPGDQFETSYYFSPRSDEGSVAFYAGWVDQGEKLGAPNGGYVPVPTQFLQAAAQDPATAMWIWKPVGAKRFIH